MSDLPKPPPPRIRMCEAARHVRTKHHTDVTRQTVYNWAKTGVKGIVLKTVTVGNRKLTTKEWVDDFLATVASARNA